MNYGKRAQEYTSLLGSRKAALKKRDTPYLLYHKERITNVAHYL